MMSWLIDQLIAFLADLKSSPLLAQLLTLAGVPGLLIGTPVWAMTRKVRASVTRYEELEQTLATARREAKRIEAERNALEAETPEAFLRGHAREMRDENDESAMALAEKYLDRQTAALALAFRTRMDEAIRQSVEDGAPAFAAARGWAQAALALEPEDRMLRMLIEELDAAEAAAAAGAQPALKDEADRKAQAAREDRLPTDIDALTQAFVAARDRGHYALMLFLAGHGLTLTRRPPFGVASRQHLLFRRRRVEALNLVGRSREALAEADPLAGDFQRVFGERSPETFYTRHLIARCRADTGDAAGALAELTELLPLRTEVQGARHPDVLATRYLIARCLADTGDAAGALAELAELLPLHTEVQGARHPDVLVTRHLIAQCRADTGDAAGALAELTELLPLRTEVQGARHPSVLSTRHLIAQCRADTGDAAGALAELMALLPLETEVHGARHPDVLGTRGLIARCRADTGDAAGALAELTALLPLYTEVQGARHPGVLAIRTLQAACLLDVGQRGQAAAAIDTVREGLAAAGLRPEHRYFGRLEAVERRLREDGG